MKANRPMLRLVRDGADETPEPRGNRLDRATGDRVMDALSDVSRRMEDLARELHCLGYFDDDNGGRPRAA